MEDRRIGKFYVDYESVENRRIAQVLVYMEFVPLRVEALAYRCKFEYIGTSPLFPSIEIGAETPEYGLAVDGAGEDIIVKVSPVK